MIATTRKTYTEARTLSGYYDRMEQRISDLRKSVNVMHSGIVSLKQSVTACFPFDDMADVEKFARKGDMTPLRIRLTSVPFKGIRSYPSDLLTSVFSRSLITFDYTWPSPQ